MVRRTYVLVGLLAAVVLLALVSSSVSSQPLLGPSDPSPGSPPHEAAPKPHQPRTVLGTDSSPFPQWVVTAATILLGLYALSLLALVVASQWGRRSGEPEPRPTLADGSEADVWTAQLGVELAEATQEQLDDILLGTPRDAIVACWMRLHAATVRAGLPPSRAETPLEFTRRAMRQLRLDTPAITELSELYREARFSEHPITESQRHQAAAALAVLAAQLAPAAVPG